MLKKIAICGAAIVFIIWLVFLITMMSFEIRCQAAGHDGAQISSDSRVVCYERVDLLVPFKER